MITRFTQEEKDLYNQLFREAEDILCGFTAVTAYENNAIYYEKKDKESITDFSGNNYEDVLKLYMQISDITNAYDFSQQLAKGVVLYKRTNEEIDEGYSVARGITSLDEYFNWIEQLARANYKFLMIPFDELKNNIFEIDANARTINVPSAFKKNGIGIQGDHLIEVIWFKIDRYFDTRDFANSVIKIHWENKDSTDYENVNYINYDFEPNKIIFPWVINKDAVKNSGSIKFAIQIGDEVEDGYVFNTQSVTVGVGAGLNHEGKNVQGDNGLESLLVSLKNSPTSNGLVKAVEPEFVTSFAVYKDLDENDEIVLEGAAVSSDTGIISYRWMWIPDGEDPDGEDDAIDLTEAKQKQTTQYNHITIDKVYVEVAKDQAKNEEYKKVTLYYKPDENGKIYRVYNGDRNNIPENISMLYSLKSQCIIKAREDNGSIIGYYYVIAQNRVNYSANSIQSNPQTLIPGPVDVIFEQDLEDKKYIDGNELLLTVNVNTDGEYDAKNHTTTEYIWEKNANSDFVYDVNAGWTVIDNETKNSLTVDSVGRYRVIAINKRNAQLSEPKTSTICRITNTPIAPNITTNVINYQIASAEAYTNPIVTTIENFNQIQYDKYEFIYSFTNLRTGVNDTDEPGTVLENQTFKEIIDASGNGTHSLNLNKYFDKFILAAELDITVNNWVNGIKTASNTIHIAIT